MSLKSTTQSFLQLVSSKLIVQFIQVLTVPIVLRFYLPNDYGKVALYSSIFSVYMIFIGFTETAKIRFSREEFEKTGKFTKSYWGTLLLRIPFIILALISVYLNAQKILTYTSLSPSILWVIYISIISSAITGSTQFLFSLEKFKLGAIINLLRSLIRILFIVLLITKLLAPTPIVLILFTLISTKSIDIIVLFFIKNKIGQPEIDWAWTKDMISFSLPFLLIIAGGLTVDYIDAIIIKRYMTFSDLGVYSVAYKLYSFGIVPFVIINTVVTPRVISIFNAQKIDSLKRFYKKILPQVYFFINQLLLIFIVFSPLLIYFVGQRYYDSIPVIAVLFGSLSWFPLIYLNEAYFVASKRTKGILLSNVSMAVINIALDIILVQKIGIMGAAVGTFVARFVAFGISAIYMYKNLRISNIYLIFINIPIIFSTTLIITDIPFPYTVSIMIILSTVSWFFAYKIRMFNNESLIFFRNIGMPHTVEKYFVWFYKKLIHHEEN